MTMKLLKKNKTSNIKSNLFLIQTVSSNKNIRYVGSKLILSRVMLPHAYLVEVVEHQNLHVSKIK